MTPLPGGDGSKVAQKKARSPHPARGGLGQPGHPCRGGIAPKAPAFALFVFVQLERGKGLQSLPGACMRADLTVPVPIAIIHFPGQPQAICFWTAFLQHVCEPERYTDSWLHFPSRFSRIFFVRNFALCNCASLLILSKPPLGICGRATHLASFPRQLCPGWQLTGELR